MKNFLFFALLLAFALLNACQKETVPTDLATSSLSGEVADRGDSTTCDSLGHHHHHHGLDSLHLDSLGHHHHGLDSLHLDSLGGHGHHPHGLDSLWHNHLDSLGHPPIDTNGHPGNGHHGGPQGGPGGGHGHGGGH